MDVNKEKRYVCVECNYQGHINEFNVNILGNIRHICPKCGSDQVGCVIRTHQRQGHEVQIRH
jgi:predicted RNA-binding Zn-ribbon protein involved in translation (DUF1610 family)